MLNVPAAAGSGGALLALLLVAATALAAEPAAEQPAAPDRLVVSAGAAPAFAGPPARIDIRFLPGAAQPTVELSFSATRDDGERWSVLLSAPAGFLQTRTLDAALTDRPLQTGQASLLCEDAGGRGHVAAAGRLQATLQAGRLQGEATMPDRPALRFDGPVAVTCAVPLDGGPALRVDEGFETPACRPYASLTATH